MKRASANCPPRRLDLDNPTFQSYIIAATALVITATAYGVAVVAVQTLLWILR